MSSLVAGNISAMGAQRIVTTSGVVAMANLQAQIDGLEAGARVGLRSLAEQAELIELVALRGYLCGMIADYELADEHADELCRSHPEEGVAYLARAKSRARFHLFVDALIDLDRAEQRGADKESIDLERATIFQAQGKYEAALELLTGATRSQRNFASLGALAVLHAERNDCVVAEEFFNESLNSYRGVSPVPLAILEFQRGHMWMLRHDPGRARFWFQTALNHLPEFVPAQGHLAEIEAMCGDMESAVERLMPLATRCDDPDYAATLARILFEAGGINEASPWNAKATARYENLISSHCDAFADHAAAFLLEQGHDPDRALFLAKRNLEIRCTRRAGDLYDRAFRAWERGPTPKAPP